ncbi:MAG: serine O-acetyltransferase [Anaerolineae bacterium]|nr:serine O-acetyltransferase [Anaerolineae bacterium]
MLRTIRDDIRSVLERDPAAYHWLQVILFYPGLHAVWLHRLAHGFWRRQFRLTAHAIAAFARFLTGIEIHPAAKIGARLFIDHGMGVVIGETAEIGEDVTIYHGVTLGGVSLSHGKRHPTIQSDVVIGAGAKILGDIIIGHGTRVGANAVVVRDVPPQMVVVGIPGKPVTRREQHPDTPDLQHGNLPDVISEKIEAILTRLEKVETRKIQEAAMLEYHI